MSEGVPRQLERHEALALFADAAPGLQADVVEAFADRGFAHAFDGRPMLAGRFVDPLTGRVAVALPYVDGALLADVEALVAAGRSLVPDAERVLLRALPDQEALVRSRLRRKVRYLSRLPAPAVHSAFVRPPSDGERALVRRWLVESFLDGAAADGWPATETTVERYVDVIAPSLRSLVAEVDGRAVGHATWAPARRDEVTGEPHAELVDIAIAPGHRGAGLSHALQAAVEADVAAAGLPVRSTYVPAGDGELLLDRLTAAGWRPLFDWWRTYERE